MPTPDQGACARIPRDQARAKPTKVSDWPLQLSRLGEEAARYRLTPQSVVQETAEHALEACQV